MYPQKIANPGIRYDTNERNIGPAREIILNLIKKAIAVGKIPKYNNDILEVKEGREKLKNPKIKAKGIDIVAALIVTKVVSAIMLISFKL